MMPYHTILSCALTHLLCTIVHLLTWNKAHACLSPSPDPRSTCSACWLSTAAMLNSTDAFSKWMLACDVRLLGLNASAHGNCTRAEPLSLLMGKRVSMAVSARKYLAQWVCK